MQRLRAPMRISKAMKPMAALLFSLFLLAASCYPLAARAQSVWSDYAFISSTIGTNAGRVCTAEASRGDLGCAANAPVVSTSTGAFGIGTNGADPSTTLHVFFPFATTGVRFGDTGHYLYFNGNTMSSAGGPLYLNYNNSQGTYINNGTGGNISLGGLTTKVNVGASANTPSTTLDVSGTLKIANGGEACDTNRAGALRYTAAGDFQVCFGSGGWSTIGSASISGTISQPDRITSGTTQLIANNNGNFEFQTSGVATGYYTPGGLLYSVGISTTSNQASFTTAYASNWLGVGITPGSASNTTGKIYAATNVAVSGGVVLGRYGNNEGIVRTWAGNALHFSTASSDTSPMLTVATSGRVGIGTTSPSSTLHIIGVSNTVGGTNNVGGLTIGTPTEARLYINPYGNTSAEMRLPQVGSQLAITNNAGTNLAGFSTNNSYVTTPLIVGSNSAGLTPSTTLQVSGTIRISDGTEACDTNRAGAIRYTSSSTFQVCYGVGGWATLDTTSSTEVIALNDLTDVSASVTSIFAGTITGATGNYNTAFGRASLANAANTGTNNSAFGRATLYSNTTGSNNTVMGVSALTSNTTGDFNTAIGTNALLFNQSGVNNIAVGTNSAMGNTTGGQNVAIGRSALLGNNYGSLNVAIGQQSAYSGNITGTVAVGALAGISLTTNGNYNTLIGYSAGNLLTTGAYNIIIGNTVNAPTPAHNRALNIGDSIFGDMTNAAGAIGGAAKIGINFVTPTQALEVSGTVSATRYVGDGSGLTGVIAAGSDRITSGTTQLVAYNGGNFEFQSSGTTTGYYTPGGLLYSVGISTTSNQASFTTIYASQRIVASVSPANLPAQSSLNVYAGNWSTGAAVTATYVQGSADQRLLNIIRNTNNNGSASFAGYAAEAPDSELTGYTRAYFGQRHRTSGGLAGQTIISGPRSLEFYINNKGHDVNNYSQYGTLAMTVSESGSVGIGTNQPSTTLHVSGTIRIADSGEACDTNRRGAMRYTSASTFQVCYGAGGWASLGTASSTEVYALNDLTDVSTSTSAGNMFLGTITGATSGVTNTTVLGTNALANNTTGFANTVIGSNAMQANTTGGWNVAIGRSALQLNTVGIQNTAIGTSALNNLTSSSDGNTAIGAFALRNATSTFASVAIGGNAGYYNTTGNRNSIIGNQAMWYNETGSNNVAIGTYAGTGTASNTTINNSVFIGDSAGNKATNSDRNIFIGTNAGQNMTSGDDNILLGTNITAPLPTSNFALNIGKAIYGDLTSAAASVGGAAKIGINFVTPTQALEVSGTVSATYFVGDGSGLTGVIAAGSDRITSGTTNVIANSNSGYVSFTSSGVTTGYYSPGGIFGAVGISTTSNQASFTTVYASGKVGIGTTQLSSSLNVAGGVIAVGGYGTNNGYTFSGNGGDTDGGLFSDADGVVKLFSNGAARLTVRDNGGTQVGINTSAPSATLQVSGTTRLGTSPSYIDFNPIAGNNDFQIVGSGGALYIGPYSAINSFRIDNSGNIRINSSVNSIFSGTGKVGIGMLTNTSFPSTTLHVSGTLRIADGGDACDADRAGAIRYTSSSTFDFCDGTTGWKSFSSMVAGVASGDRITSGTTSIIANNNQSLTFTAGGASSMNMGSDGRIRMGAVTGYLSTVSTATVIISRADVTVPALSVTGGKGGINIAEFYREDGVANAKIIISANGALPGIGFTQGTNISNSWALGTNIGGDRLNFGYGANTLASTIIQPMTLVSSGNVGIATTNPSTTLDISGTLRIAGTGAETCNAASIGMNRRNPSTGKVEMCRY